MSTLPMTAFQGMVGQKKASMPESSLDFLCLQKCHHKYARMQ
jgi:hypothetical protein